MLAACVPRLPISSRYPSGAARAIRSVPMVPPAPDAFSTMTLWPSVRLMCSARMRVTVSVPPPAANGTTTVIGRAG